MRACPSTSRRFTSKKVTTDRSLEHEQTHGVRSDWRQSAESGLD